MIASDQFVFIRNPKTASRSVKKLLSAHFDTKEIGTDHAYKVPEEYRNRTIFAFVRNPFSRAVSGWKHYCRDVDMVRARQKVNSNQGYLPFKDFLAGRKLGQLFYQSTIWEYAEEHGYEVTPLRYESIRTELQKLDFMPKDFDLPEIGVTGYDWTKEYDAETEALAAEVLAKDFERFGYPRSRSLL